MPCAAVTEPLLPNTVRNRRELANFRIQNAVVVKRSRFEAIAPSESEHFRASGYQAVRSLQKGGRVQVRRVSVAHTTSSRSIWRFYQHA